MPNYRSTKTAMALRYESLPFSLPFSKKELTSKIRSKKEELGITNTPMYFNGKQLKATMIYLDTFDGLTQKKLLKSKKSFPTYVNTCI